MKDLEGRNIQVDLASYFDTPQIQICFPLQLPSVGKCVMLNLSPQMAVTLARLLRQQVACLKKEKTAKKCLQ